MKSSRGQKITGSAGIILFVGLVIIGGIHFFSNRPSDGSSPAPAPAQWTLIKEIRYDNAAYFAGFFNEQFGLTVGPSGVTYSTTDGGVTWTEGVNEANCRFSLDILNEGCLWTVGNYGGNRVSTDGGKTLFAVADLPLIDHFTNNLVDILDEAHVVVGSPLRLAFTEDGGAHWTDMQLPESCEFLAGMSFISMEKGYIMDNQGQLYATENSGREWTALTRMPLVEGIRVNDRPSVAMRVNADNIATIVYLDKNSLAYGFQIDLSAENSGGDSSEAWQAVQLNAEKYVIPYLSKDGRYLTTYNLRNSIQLFRLE